MSNQTRYRQGVAAFAAGRYTEAISLLEPLAGGAYGAMQLLSRYYLGRAHYLRAVELFRQRRFDQAAAHFQTSARVNPSGQGLGGFLTACFVGSGRYDLAVAELEKMIKARPDDTDTRVRLALAQYKKGDMLAATATLRDGLSRQPTHPELNYQLGVLMAAEDQLAEAERYFDRALAADSKHVRALERLSQCYGVNGRYQRALDYIQRAQHLDPTDSRIAMQLNLLARALNEQGQPTEIDWRQYQDGTCGDLRTLDRLGELVIREPDFVEAFLSLPTTEMDEEVFSMLALVLERTLDAYPEYADLHYHCGEVYRRLHRQDKAITHAERAVELNPRYINALLLLARLYSQTDRQQDGVLRLEQAITAGADYPDVYYLLGQLAQECGQNDRARDAYRRALALKDDYQAARKALTDLPA